jgi:osmotically-inducible protein OsmY
MYFLDPESGRRRRALVRDKMIDAGRDLQNKTRGIAAELKSRFSEEAPSDRVLEERVRARIGQAGQHTGAIHVEAQNGIVALSGPILTAEVDMLLKSIRQVPGVREVDSQLEAYDSPDGVPSLQSSGSNPEESASAQRTS